MKNRCGSVLSLETDLDDDEGQRHFALWMDGPRALMTVTIEKGYSDEQ